MFAAIALDPLGEEDLDFVAAAVAGEAFLHNAFHAVAHLAGGGGHTEAELGVVLKQRVGPGGTEAAAVVAAIGGGRSRAAVDGGATRGVGHHHLLAEELGDALEVIFRTIRHSCIPIISEPSTTMMSLSPMIVAPSKDSLMDKR